MGTKWAVKNNGVVQLNLFSSAPSGEEGQIYYNSTTKKLYYHNGTQWVETGGFNIYDDFEDGTIDGSKWVVDLSGSSGSGWASVTESNGSIYLQAHVNSQNPSDIGNATLTTTKNFKNAGKIEFDVSCGIRNGYDVGTTYAQVILTDGTNTSVLVQWSKTTQGGSGTDSGGGACIRLLCAGNTVTGKVVGAGSRGGPGYTFETNISVDVSSWSAVYVRFVVYTRGDTGSNPNGDVYMKVSHMLEPINAYL